MELTPGVVGEEGVVAFAGGGCDSGGDAVCGLHRGGRGDAPGRVEVARPGVLDEQLPRLMRVEIYEREVNGKKFVFQKSNGLLLGDRLTDNHLPEDDYRFHDVFHLAYAGVLGWSPTTRALLKIKRKSLSKVDENEDGARANLIEEGLATWIFETAKRHHFFANTPQLGLDLLKAVKGFVRGYEAYRLPLWLWERAILQGFAVFRELQVHRRGIVTADLIRREIRFEPWPPES
jgi:hypothetical protein